MDGFFNRLLERIDECGHSTTSSLVWHTTKASAKVIGHVVQFARRRYCTGNGRMTDDKF